MIPRRFSALTAPRAAFATLALFLTIVACSRDAEAGGSSPVLALASADVAALPSGPIVLRAGGGFSFDDVVEDVFGLSLVVVHGSRWARYRQDGAVAEGDSAIVADGLDLSEVAAFLATAGSTAAPPARLDGITRDGVTVVLPDGFPSGDATVFLAAVFDGDSFLSNAIAVVVP